MEHLTASTSPIPFSGEDWFDPLEDAIRFRGCRSIPIWKQFSDTVGNGMRRSAPFDDHLSTDAPGVWWFIVLRNLGVRAAGGLNGWHVA